jgi:hypothetical protein
MSSILTCGPFLHRIPTIQRRREGTYLSAEMYQQREPLLVDAANKNLPNTYFRGPKEIRPKKDRMPRLTKRSYWKFKYSSWISKTAFVYLGMHCNCVCGRSSLVTIMQQYTPKFIPSSPSKLIERMTMGQLRSKRYLKDICLSRIE